MLQGTVFALLNRDGLLVDAGSRSNTFGVLESSEDDKAFFSFSRLTTNQSMRVS